MDGTREGLIFDVKKYSINDGPGIRTTVFFKGCPLSCRWCHNPEGQSSAPEIMVRASRCLADCRECVSVCSEKAVAKPALVPVLDRSKCNLCGKCAEVCPAQAVQVVGRRITASELLLEIESDRIFQEESGGGVTFPEESLYPSPIFWAKSSTSAGRKRSIPRSIPAGLPRPKCWTGSPPKRTSSYTILKSWMTKNMPPSPVSPTRRCSRTSGGSRPRAIKQSSAFP